MKIARVIPKFDALPKLTAFQCLDCREVVTVEGDGYAKGSAVEYMGIEFAVRARVLAATDGL
jgi:hypothetical protein